MTPSATKKTVKLVPIEQIDETNSVQIRITLDARLVHQYRSLIQEHGNMDPIHIFRNGDNSYRVADGFHRIEAYRQENKLEIPAVIHDGDASDALKYALLENSHHGARLTNADKRRAVELAVTDEKIGEWKDTQIAKYIGVSLSLVGEIRRGETKQAKKKKVAERKAKREASTRGVTAREREEPDDRPTKAMILRQIQDYLTNDVVDEAEVVKLMEGPKAAWQWSAKPGMITALKS